MKKFKKIITDTDIISTDQPMFSLRFLFLLAIVGSAIFYRFVYIYIYNLPIAQTLYDYKISYSAKLYIEGFFLTAWVIFLVSFLFRTSQFMYDKILIPALRIVGYIIIKFLYSLDFIIETIYFKIRKQKIDEDKVVLNIHKRIMRKEPPHLEKKKNTK